MREIDKKCLEDGTEYRLIDIACGGKNCTRMDAITGYCHSSCHRGYVTDTVLKGHNCIEKNCTNYERFENYPYWIHKKRSEESKAIHKAVLKKKKDKQRQLEEDRQAVLDAYKNGATRLAEKYNYPIKIISAREFNDNYVLLLFVSDARRNDAYDYKDVGLDLHYSFPKKYFYMKRIVRSDGQYATTADICKK